MKIPMRPEPKPLGNYYGYPDDDEIPLIIYVTAGILSGGLVGAILVLLLLLLGG